MNQIMLERRQFLQAGGALVVGFALRPSHLLWRNRQRRVRFR